MAGRAGHREWLQALQGGLEEVGAPDDYEIPVLLRGKVPKQNSKNLIIKNIPNLLVWDECEINAWNECWCGAENGARTRGAASLRQAIHVTPRRLRPPTPRGWVEVV